MCPDSSVCWSNAAQGRVSPPRQPDRRGVSVVDRYAATAGYLGLLVGHRTAKLRPDQVSTLLSMQVLWPVRSTLSNTEFGRPDTRSAQRSRQVWLSVRVIQRRRSIVEFLVEEADEQLERPRSVLRHVDTRHLDWAQPAEPSERDTARVDRRR